MEQQIIATSWWMVDLLNLFMLYAFVMNYPVGPKHSHAVTYHQIGMFKKSSFEKYGGVQRSGNSVVKIQNGLLQHWCIQACWKFNVIFFNPKHFFGSPAQKIHSFCFACAFWFCEIFVILGGIVSFYHGQHVSFSILFLKNFVGKDLLYLETIPA